MYTNNTFVTRKYEVSIL